MKFINKIAILQKVLVELKSAETGRHVLQGSTIHLIFDTIKHSSKIKFKRYAIFKCSFESKKVNNKVELRVEQDLI